MAAADSARCRVGADDRLGATHRSRVHDGRSRGERTRWTPTASVRDERPSDMATVRPSACKMAVALDAENGSSAPYVLAIPTVRRSRAEPAPETKTGAPEDGVAAAPEDGVAAAPQKSSSAAISRPRPQLRARVCDVTVRCSCRRTRAGQRLVCRRRPRAMSETSFADVPPICR